MRGPTSPAGPRVLRVCLACNLPEVQTTARVVRDFRAEQGCVPHELMDYQLALVEACNNAIKHADPDGLKKPVGVEVLWGQSEVELRITDHTAGFDWPEQTNLPEPERESGRGLYLMKSLMDYANYFRGPAENVLVLRKRRVALKPKMGSACDTSERRRLPDQRRER